MTSELISMSVLGGLFLTIFGVAECLYLRGVSANTTRRVVHACSGLLALSFPLVLSSTSSVLVLCGSFLLILALSQKFGWLGSIHKVDRRSRGAVLFPISVFLLYLLARRTDDNAMFYVPLAVLALADPVAAAVGKRFPVGPYALHPRATKSVAGSGAFFGVTIVVFASAQLLVQAFTVLHSSWFSHLHGQTGCFAGYAACAAATTFGEALGHDGYDNLTIPLFAAVSMLLVAS